MGRICWRPSLKGPTGSKSALSQRVGVSIELAMHGTIGKRVKYPVQKFTNRKQNSPRRKSALNYYHLLREQPRHQLIRQANPMTFGPSKNKAHSHLFHCSANIWS